MANEFISGGLLQSIINPQGVNLQGFAQPLAQGLIRRGENERLESLRAQELAREDALLSDQNDLRDNAAFALSIKNLPEEQRAQALSARFDQAAQENDFDNAESIEQLMQMDSPSLNTTLDELIFQGAKFLPAGALQGLGLSGKSKGFASAKTETYPDGTVLQALPDGSSQVIAPSGAIVTDPKERVEVLRRAEESLGLRARTKSKESVLGKAQGESQAADIAAETEAKIVEAKGLAEIGAAANKEEQKELGKLRGEIASEETKNFRSSKSQDLQLKQLSRALDLASTGKYAQLRSSVGKFIPGVETANEEALQSIVTSYVMGELAKQTGPKTDFDFIKAAETQIQSGNTKAANEIILKRMKENQDYSKKRWAAWQKHKKAGKNAEDFEDSFTYKSVFDRGEPESTADTDVKAMSNEDLFK